MSQTTTIHSQRCLVEKNFSQKTLQQARVVKIFVKTKGKCVVHCKSNDNLSHFVVKHMEKCFCRQYVAEVNALLRCDNRHELIAKLWYYEVDFMQNCTIVMPFVSSGTLWDSMNNNNNNDNKCSTTTTTTLNILHLHFYLLELTEALTFIHHCDIIHHDVKLENVLVNSDGHIVLTDFGNSRYARLGESVQNAWRNQAEHMPMEVHTDILNYPQGSTVNYINHSLDWFSLGVLCYFCLFKQLPFNRPLVPQYQPHEILFPSLNNNHTDHSLTSTPTPTPTLDDDLLDLLKRLLEMDAKQRLGCSTRDGFEIFSHKWVRSFDPIVESIWLSKGSEGLSAYVRDKKLAVPQQTLL